MRSQIFDDLNDYAATEAEKGFVRPAQELLNKQDAFLRTCFSPGHFTGSGILIDASGSQILLNHHKSLNKWLCFGGHADGHEDIRQVALRETCEESGYTESDIEFVTKDILDIDIHEIAENKNRGEPKHYHYDIAFLFRLKKSKMTDYKISSESHDLMWCPLDQSYKFISNDDHMVRIVGKIKKIV